MQIQANCKYDFEATKSLTYLTMFKRGNPKKRMLLITIFFVVLFFIVIFEIIIFGIDATFILLSIIIVFMLLINYFMWYLSPKVRYNSLAKLKNICNEYIFTEESVFATTKSTEYEGKVEIAYTLFVKVYETSNYLFLFQTQNQVYMVDKSTLVGGTIEEIRNKLCNHLYNKYIICKY